MKKILVLLVTILVACFGVFTLSACENQASKYKLKFIVDNELYTTIETSGNEIITLPDNPSKEGFSFDGWFFDKDVWEDPFLTNSLLEVSLSEDLSVYAKFVENHSHTYSSIITEPTCKEKGYTTYACSCGHSYVDNYVNEVEHDFINYVSDDNATLTQDGTKTANCRFSDCTEKSTIIDVGSKLVPSDGLIYSLNADNSSYSVTGIGTCKDSRLIIPQTYKGKPVTKITQFAFRWCNFIERVTMFDDMLTIEPEAFVSCTRLKIIDLPNTIVHLSRDSFFNCPGILYNEKDGIEYLGNRENKYLYLAQRQDENITTATIDSGCRILGDYAFNDCTLLQSIVIPKSVVSMGWFVFSDCKSLTSIMFEQNSQLTNIGSFAFSGCNLLESIIIPDSVVEINARAFNECSSLKNIEIGKSVKNIDEDSFRNCISLESIEIPNGVTSIDAGAFTYCESLTNIKLPNSLELVGENLFYGCLSLTYNIKDGLCYLGSDDNLYLYLCGVKHETSSSLDTIKIADTCKFIGENALAGCSTKKIEIPSSVKLIMRYAFSGCRLLENIKVDSNNTTFKDIDGNLYSKDGTVLLHYALGKEDSTFIIPNTVQIIGNDVFSYSHNLISVIIPDSVTMIGEDVCRACMKLESIIFNDTSTWYSTNDYVNWQNKTGGTIFDVTDSGANATYFISTYLEYWYKI